MSDGAEVVILAQREERDPRDDETKTTVRVVLHTRTRRALVDIERGTDAAGRPSVVRLDPYAPDATAVDVLGAYSFVSVTLTEWYERAIAAERRAVEAETRAQRAESRTRSAAAMPLLPTDPKAAAKQRLDKLLDLATHNDTPDHERAAAAVQAAQIIRKHSLSVK